MARYRIEYHPSAIQRRRGRGAYFLSTLAVAAGLAAALVFVPGPASAGRPGGGGGGGGGAGTPTPSVPKVLHVADIDGAAANAKGGWAAKVTVTVHDAGHAPVSGVTVAARWTDGVGGTVACVTGRSGSCTLTSPKATTSVASIGFKVDGLALSGSTYDSAANHDPDGSSDGTSTTVTR
jgi:hypothetical protein